MYKQKENEKIYDRLRQYKNELKDVVRIERHIGQDYLRNILTYQRKNIENRLDKIKYEIQ